MQNDQIHDKDACLAAAAAYYLEASATLVAQLTAVKSKAGKPIIAFQAIAKAMRTAEFYELVVKVRRADRDANTSENCLKDEHTKCVGSGAISTSCACWCHGSHGKCEDY